MDMRKLESTGKLRVTYLGLEETLNKEPIDDTTPPSSSSPSSFSSMISDRGSWADLEAWVDAFAATRNGIKTNPDTNAPAIALMFDDLDMLELLAPSPLHARKLIHKVLSLLLPVSPPALGSLDCAPAVCDYDGHFCHDGILHSVTAFGRQPADVHTQFSTTLTTAFGAPAGFGDSGILSGAVSEGVDGPGSGVAEALPPLDEDGCPSLTEYLRYR